MRSKRFTAAVALVASIGLLPLLNRYESLFNGINDIIAHIAPPITTVFLLGIFWKKASAKSAQYTLWLGSLFGAAVFVLNKVYPSTILGQVPFMMMAFYLFCACVLLQVLLSYIFPVQHTAVSDALYWKSPLEPLSSKGWNGIDNYKLLSLVLLLMMIVLYWIFR